jgi:hypothetical protein
MTLVELNLTQRKEVHSILGFETTWRWLNMALFVIAFSGPWGTIFGDTIYGTDMVRASVHFVMAWLSGAQTSDFWVGFGLYYCFGWVCFSAHWAISIFRTFGRAPFNRKHWLRVPLVVSTAFLLLDMLPRIFRNYYHRFWWPDLYWGYWLLLLSIGSSLTLELTSFITNGIGQRTSSA